MAVVLPRPRPFVDAVRNSLVSASEQELNHRNWDILLPIPSR